MCCYDIYYTIINMLLTWSVNKGCILLFNMRPKQTNAININYCNNFTQNFVLTTGN